MPQNTDIVLNGAGYMVEPGSYKRLQDGMAEGRTERISITDFFGGQHRALQLERDKFHDSLSIRPVLGGQGVQPWGSTSTFVPGVWTIFPNRETHVPWVIVKDRIYLAIGTTLIRGPITKHDQNFDWAVIQTFPNPIVDMCIYSSYAMLITFGSAADILFYNTNTNTTAVLFTGSRGFGIESYAGHAAWSDARTSSRPTIIQLVSGTGFDTRALDHDPIALKVIGAELCVVTKQSLYTYNGRVKEVTAPGGTGTIHEWSGEFTPFFQQGMHSNRDDYRLLESYGGRIIAWIAGGVHEKVPSGDRAGWRSTGLDGKRCFGGCVASGYLFVCIESHAGNNEVWAYDGSGWWRLATKPMPADGIGTWCNPFPSGGAGSARHFNCFMDGQNTLQTWRLSDHVNVGGTFLAGLASTAEFVSPMIDANERDKPKAWRKIGAVFASPVTHGRLTSTDLVGVYIDYSIDGGATWVEGGTPEGTYNQFADNTIANMNFTLEGTLSGKVSNFLMLRVRWISVLDWAPILTGVWAEYEVLHNPARRRKWQLKVHARDQEIDRDGIRLSRTGRQLISELWASWQNDAAETFRDIDYDADPVQRTVRIVGISEAVAQPADSNEWGDSIITLNLVEV